MSTEEKAKAYDEALKRFKAFKEKYYTKDTQVGDIIFDKTGKMQKDFEDIFPQLAESKDERIRKWLLKCVKSLYDVNFIEVSRQDVLAYLEKQKYDRMKPIYDARDSFESALAKAWKEYNDSGSRTVDGCEDNYAECAHAKGFREGYLFGIEKQKEDEVRLKEEIDAFNESVKEYLNSLYSQSEQKWSEEDEKIINTIVSALGQYIDYKVSGTSSVSSVYVTPRYGKEINWLKSLRPSWKPTYKQLKALRKAVNKLDNTDGDDSIRLSILYDHLKELM